MREFIGNPFQQEFEDGDELDEFEDVLRIVEADRIIEPSDAEDEEEEDVIIETDNDDNEDDDPDYILENDGYDPEDEDLDFDDVHDAVSYLRGFSSDEEEEDELEYFTFPANNSLDLVNKPPNQESSNSSNSDEEFVGDET